MPTFNQLYKLTDAGMLAAAAQPVATRGPSSPRQRQPAQRRWHQSAMRLFISRAAAWFKSFAPPFCHPPLPWLPADVPNALRALLGMPKMRRQTGGGESGDATPLERLGRFSIRKAHRTAQSAVRAVGASVCKCGTSRWRSSVPE